ncbi:MAG: tRNA preQ1(34) S-adenosylmethionine ribosyltransferase-isomerase QueA [Christensenellales bacterium]|jgi:S-adenosylmethionine:tRNA ribosyltransferase-isomerase
MKTSDFFYPLPEELIAQKPIEPRDSSRLMVLDENGNISHRVFRDIAEFFRPGDVLVVNNTKVLPARLLGRTVSGAAMEFLLLRRLDIARWEVLVKPGRKARPGAVISFGDEGCALKARVESLEEGGNRIVEFLWEGVFEDVLDRLGQMPLPPYITEKLEDKSRYQTVYAKEDGSAAAPTAGLHFTDSVLFQIAQRGVKVVPVLLHVGLGTFRPVKADDISDHRMHSEYYEISPETADVINSAKLAGGRIICTGTTTVRTLESSLQDGFVKAGAGWTDIFITPGYEFKTADMLITNFHLPCSTLMMLVSAFAGKDEIMRAYGSAVKEKYRFFSFGDAMLLYKK